MEIRKMKPPFKFSFFSFLFIFILISTSSLTTPKVKGKTDISSSVKRGAILDRNFEPIALSTEFYKAYYLIEEGFFSKNPSPLVAKYLPSFLELPKKGLWLLSDNIDSKEVEKLKREENVFIESYYVRLLLQPFMKFLIGEVINETGVSGLEMIFNGVLKEGNWIRISLDMKLQRELYHRIKNNPLSVAVIDLKSGEFLVYWEPSESSYFTQYFPLSDFGLNREEVSSLRWELGEIKVVNKNSKVKITPLHLAKWFFNKACNNTEELTLLPRVPLCQPSLEVFAKFPCIFYLENKVLYLAFKKDRLIILMDEIVEKPQIKLNNLKHLAQKL
ncbi:MAG: hypothetical protein NZ530_00245 [Thermodesulfobacteriaceae bacterium]|nr:hypothetical protein [Thermodesulfobacteriaceae bacterium]MDW8135337.1 hypothetical protein [Thermodesulfobacterium sp.]